MDQLEPATATERDARLLTPLRHKREASDSD